MVDNEIIELYFARDEIAIERTREKYGRLIYSVANRILDDEGESEECENDTYFRAWNAIPPTRPSNFSAYLSKITRNLALNRLRDYSRKPDTLLILDELGEAIPGVESDPVADIELRDALCDFLAGLSKTKRQIFMKRYFYMCSIKEIARQTSATQGSVKATLSRTRAELREFLENRGVSI